MIWWSSKENIMEFLEPRLKEDKVDLIISVHPLINHVVMEALYELDDKEMMYFIPRVVTVVTDLGSAHPSWFEPRIDLLFVPSQELQQLAEGHGVSNEKIVFSGLPLRGGFWKEDPRSQHDLQKLCGLRPAEPGQPEIVLVMGGGEGFGAILSVAQAVGEMLAGRGTPGQLVVVCGRNEEAKMQLEDHTWPCKDDGKFLAHILGFVPNINEYMGAAYCLVTKAGPGTIAEAMIKGLPCMLTSFVPGQEEGNISIVTKNGAGLYIPDSEPERIAKELESWLDHPAQLRRMSEHARRLGRPKATLDIARRIGDGLMNLGVELMETDFKRRCAEAVDDTSPEYFPSPASSEASELLAEDPPGA
jgi:1,2-diacylglycerol 3-beta-galactosyltransferase